MGQGVKILDLNEIKDRVVQMVLDELQTKYLNQTVDFKEEQSNNNENSGIKQTNAETVIDYKKIIENYLKINDWRVKENSTVTYSVGGLMLSNSGAITANYWLSEVYDEEIANAHKNTEIHIHDLSMLTGYCAGWSLKQLITDGLGGVQGKITSTPANHLSTLCNQMVNFLGIMQNEWAGAQAFSSFDTYLAPFVKVDDLSQKEVKQCIQSFVYGVNTPSRWGTQAPFTNVTIDWVCPPDMKNLPAIIGGREMDFTYGDCQKEMDMVNKAFIEVMIEGDANGRGFQYPIPTYSITRDFDWSETENNKLLFEMTAKYGTPYFSNYINSDMEPSDVRSMCPLTPDTFVIVKSKQNGIRVDTIHNIYNTYKHHNTNYEVWTGHGWCKGHPIQTPKTKVYNIKFNNGLSVKMGANHLQPTKDFGTLHADELRPGMWLPFNKNCYGTDLGNDEDEQYIYYSIDSIEECDYVGDFLYCFEIENEDHLFALANGLITHNCRLRLDLRELRKKSGGFFGSGESTGSIGVVTINLPRIAYLAADEKDFYCRLDKLMDIAARSLKIKRDFISKLMDQGLYPYTKRYLGSFSNHFSTIGLVGANEACLNAKWLKVSLADKAAQQFVKDVLNHMRERLSDYQEMYGDLYNLEATPAESTTYRFAKHDKEEFPDIITANMNGTPYYTNSSHLPVGYTEDVFSALDIQDDLQTLYTSGTVFHAFLGEKLPDWKAAAALVRKIAENYKLPYYTLSPTYSVCKEHGYLTGEHAVCPICGQKTEVYSRITGYYRPVQNWNDGKAQEYLDRKVYNIPYSMGAHLDKIQQTEQEEESCSACVINNEEQILLFKTPTCPNCKAATAILDKAGIIYNSINANEEPDLVKKYEIKQAPTLVLTNKDGFKKYRGVSEIKGWLLDNK